MIEVTIIDTGDTAEAETPEAAMLAAKTLGEEARVASGAWGNDPRITFTVDGAIVATTTLRELARRELFAMHQEA